ncbi:universal stress protein [Halosegnis rubeus]|jgi:nucleotide-binding universal stress UspA family protein|uniref:Universal stress protein n=1 Tax=Halosegnis rubeus TaxID=2212850 RepID=A0A5N5U9S4_9EURY|nr:universal stress protein [Halosegnis rubeus]KAB7515258.1 universal stress protein [Halosegnis rubeus]KAB7516312.1 universal stress protein [Halosegnis rubeus]KAB7517700.1 universal stress protein [Halosegnis rubeus]
MNVLLGIGGSEDSFRALDKTIDRAQEAGDSLTVAILENPDSDPDPDDLAERARTALEDAGLTPDVHVLEGHAGSQLVDFAEREGHELIVLGGGETSPLGKVQLGSIAEFVLLNATVSVTLVR